MDSGGCFFERNLRALAPRDPELCARLRAAAAGGAGGGAYEFSSASSGGLVPALLGGGGRARPLHSMVDPRREAGRLVSSAAGPSGAGFFVFLGLGGGFLPRAALEASPASFALAVEFGAGGVAELFRAVDYSALLGSPRFSLLVDPSPAAVEGAVLELYLPALSGGVSALPLRARVERDAAAFGAAGEAARRGIERVSADYSVQAHFGLRWHANIVRNIARMGRARAAPPGAAGPGFAPGREVAVCAAGPSLDAQLPELAERKRRGALVVCSDTALPALLGGGLRPDAVVSIDCQHATLRHFAGSACRGAQLFLDLASPPELARLSPSAVFFSGGHPLARYACLKWARLPELDASGGNVAYACLSLAESLGARRVEVFGADFSYPAGRIYARGTYLFRFFGERQCRLSPLEAQVSEFLFRAPFLPPEAGAPPGFRRYETATLRAYRRGFGRKISEMEAEVVVAPGLGLPPPARAKRPARARPWDWGGLAAGKPASGAVEFLREYAREVEALPPLGEAGGLGAEARRVFATLLPLMAALRRRRPELPPADLLAEAKRRCAGEIEKVLGAQRFELRTSTV